MAFPLHHCHKSCRRPVAYSDREYIAQVTQSNKVKGAWRAQHCKSNRGMFVDDQIQNVPTTSKIQLDCTKTCRNMLRIFFCFFLLSQLSEPGRLGTALSGPASRLASAMTFSGCDTSPTVDCCSFSICRTQSPKELGRVGERSLGCTDCRTATVTSFFFFSFNAYAEKERTRREGRQNSPLASQ